MSPAWWCLITCHSNLTSSHVNPWGLSVQQCWHCINFSTAQNSFPPLCVFRMPACPTLSHSLHTYAHSFDSHSDAVLSEKVQHMLHLQSRRDDAALERYTETPRVPGQPWVHLPRLFSDLPSPFTSWRAVQNSFHTGWHHQTDFTHRATTAFVFQHEENRFVLSRHENGTRGGWMEPSQPARQKSKCLCNLTPPCSNSTGWNRSNQDFVPKSTKGRGAEVP